MYSNIITYNDGNIVALDAFPVQNPHIQNIPISWSTILSGPCSDLGVECHSTFSLLMTLVPTSSTKLSGWMDSIDVSIINSIQSIISHQVTYTIWKNWTWLMAPMYCCLYEARIHHRFCGLSLEPPTLEDTTHVKVGWRGTDIFWTKLQGGIVDVLAKSTDGWWRHDMTAERIH